MKEIQEVCLDELTESYPKLAGIRPDIQKAYLRLCECFMKGNRLFICGNGGSAADSLHIVGELMKEFMVKRPVDAETTEKLCRMYPGEARELIENLQGALPAYALPCNAALSSAYANDVNCEYEFAQQVYGYAKSGDVLFALSTSGNAKNVVAAAKIARCKGLGTIAVTGRDGGKLKDVCDIVIAVPARETYRIQELHLPVYHTLCRMLELRFFGKAELDAADKILQG